MNKKSEYFYENLLQYSKQNYVSILLVWNTGSIICILQYNTFEVFLLFEFFLQAYNEIWSYQSWFSFCLYLILPPPTHQVLNSFNNSLNLFNEVIMNMNMGPSNEAWETY